MSDSEYAIRPNKTQLKREVRALNDLGKELIALTEAKLKKMPLSESMYIAIKDGKRFQRGALQRQLRRITSMMRHEDVDAIRLEIERLKQPSREQQAKFHQVEKWRDSLLAGDESVFHALVAQFPDLDRQHLRQLVRNGISEKKREKPPKSARLIFKYLNELQSQPNNHDNDDEASDGSENDNAVNPGSPN